MTRTRLFGSLIAGLAAAVVLAGSGPAGGQERKKAEPHIVKKITKVEYAFLERRPPVLEVTAYGEVPTSGYDPDKVLLTRVLYITPPDDGIQDYTLTAVPPGGIVNPVISTVKGVNKWEAPAKWVKGVRIHGVDDGVKVVVFGEKK